MTLGQRIAECRKAKGFSQEDLANLLNISRQSVYKWESDQSVPELDKLVTLGEIFGVTLDELIKGEKYTDKPDSVKSVPDFDDSSDNSIRSKRSIKQTVLGGISLAVGLIVSLLLTVLGAGPLGFVYGIPFFAMGIICLVSEKYTGLKCAWAAYISFCFYMRLATGISASLVWKTLEWEASMNYVRLTFGWVMCLLLLLMVFVTVKAMLKNHQKSEKDLIIAIVCAVLFVAMKYFPLGKILINNIPNDASTANYITFINIVFELLSLVRTGLVIIFAGKVIPLVKAKITEGKTQ